MGKVKTRGGSERGQVDSLYEKKLTVRLFASLTVCNELWDASPLIANRDSNVNTHKINTHRNQCNQARRVHRIIKSREDLNMPMRNE